MSTALQNRLVGTIILVALAVIFLPDILDGKKVSNKDVFVELPQRPAMRPVAEGEAFPTETVEKAVQRQPEVVNEAPLDDNPQGTVVVPEPVDTSGQSAARDQNGAQPKSSLEQETVVETADDALLESAGWVVQLGVFRHDKNVRELLNKLEDAGYRAFSRPIETSSGRLTKVFVGPDLQKDKLEKAMPHLNELTGLQGRITPFTVK